MTILNRNVKADLWSPQRLGLGVDRGDVPMRAGTGHLQSLTGDHQRLVGQPGPDRLDRGIWQRGQVHQGFVLDLAELTHSLGWARGLVITGHRQSVALAERAAPGLRQNPPCAGSVLAGPRHDGP
jgi:hypothetical protein